MKLSGEIIGILLAALAFSLVKLINWVPVYRARQAQLTSDIERDKARQREETNRQLVAERNAHYGKFWNEAHALMDEMATGAFRMPNLHVVRGRYGILLQTAPGPVVQRLQAITRVFEEVIKDGITEERYARFNREMHELRDACRVDTGLDPLRKPLQADAAAPAETSPQSAAESRRYFSPADHG
ncbi:MAG: hypothetical protein AMXMBFR8_11270 [Nevskiales bacterium]